MSLGTTWQVVRRLGALSLLVVGAVHLREYHDGYAEIETIGTLFMLNFLAATIMGVGLLLPVERLVPRWGKPLVLLLALGGVGLSATSFVMLLISERRPLFGFMEPGFHPDMIRLSRISEVTTVVLLGVFLISQLFGGFSGPDRTSRSRKPEEMHHMVTKNRALRAVLPSVAAVAALVLSGCGGDDDDGAATVPVSVPDGADVAAADIGGQSVLVNADGQALYVSDEESNGEVLCVTDGCVAFWEPLTIDGTAPVGEVEGELGVVERPDGASQVTFGGRPLYTFSEDSAGEVTGDGFADTFDGQTLTWHVMTATGTTGTGTTDTPADPYDY